MKVLLIAPPLMDRTNGVLHPISMDAHRECPPYGIFLLAQRLRQDGHETIIADLIALGTNRLDVFWPHLATCHLVGIGTSSLSWPTARDCIGQIRQLRPDVPIVLGGIHATMFDRYVLATSGADYVIRGEGERALPALCHVLERGGDLRTVPNLSIRLADGGTVRTPLAPLIPPEDLARSPVPDYRGIPPGIYNGLGIESSRGCPFDCAFCSTSYRRTWRPIAPGAFVDRLEAILPNAPRTRSGAIQVVDDEFAIRPARVVEICRELSRRRIQAYLVFDSRANDLLDESYVEAITPYALQFLVGAECGYDEGLERVGKGTTCAKLEGAAAALRRLGIAGRADFSFILGLPWETKQEVLQTVRFACGLYARYGVRVLLQWYCLIPGSRLWQEAREDQLVHEAMYDDFGFFQNLGLFRAGVRLTPAEIREVSESLAPVVALSRLHSPERAMVEYAHPEPIARSFPKLGAAQTDGLGLSSLREVAKPETASSRCAEGDSAREALKGREVSDGR
ncbi:MAG: B12-binding domain-containing radical SAM protein [Planctomycetes bacterium]|nr:B12-binding domain-containing radical SAM protein [Planctomycetota bacterium]